MQFLLKNFADFKIAWPLQIGLDESEEDVDNVYPDY